MRLEPIAEGLWGASGSVRFLGQRLPARATVARLNDGSLLMRSNRAAARAGVEHILAWDFDRVIPAHGEVLQSGAKSALVEAFRFLGVRS